ncbi:hypothetical protein [Paenibacillus camerounensis]|nr:hypothetical protein [Paenibacillus camerounensis]
MMLVGRERKAAVMLVGREHSGWLSGDPGAQWAAKGMRAMA